MIQPQHFNRLETLHRLGLSYTGYRLLLALGLFFILLVTHDNLLIGARNPDLYFFISSAYIGLCVTNFLTFKLYQKKLPQQIFIYLILDIIHLTLILYLSSGPNIAIILLYMIVVLVSTMLLTKKKALVLTLLSVIAVVYQQFFFSIFEGEKISFIGTSSLITLVFLSTYILGQITVNRMNFVEALAIDQRKEILQLQNIHQNILQQLDTGFMVLDADGKIITLNDAAHTFLSIDTFSVHHQDNLMQLLPNLYKILQQHSTTQLRGVFHFFFDDETTGLSIQYRPIATQQQQFTLLIIDSLQKINQQAQQLKLASLGQLSASIAHEIRNPLAVISQANELLQGDLDDQQQQLSAMIHKQCTRINRIIEDTLNMSRQNQTIAENISLDIWLINFIEEDLQDVKKFLNIDIEANLVIHFDPHQLRLVLINLVRNAIRHGHQHQPESLVTIHAHCAGDAIFIDVLDQGMGVPERQQRNLFAPFYSTAIDGTGLGLYLSKTFCEANHARLKYVAQTQGACFRIECL